MGTGLPVGIKAVFLLVGFLMEYGEKDSGFGVFRPGNGQAGWTDGENPFRLCHAAAGTAPFGLQAGFFRYGSPEKRQMEDSRSFAQAVLLPGGGLPSCAEQFGKVFPCAVPFLQAMGLRYPLHGDWRMAGCFPEGPSGAGAGLVKDKGCFS